MNSLMQFLDTDLNPREDRWVALKIIVSENSNNGEVRVPQAISALPRDHPGRDHLVQMLDHFTFDGPNGSHCCIVMELLSPSVPDTVEYYTDYRLPATVAKATAYQALLAVDFLSQHKICHGGKSPKEALSAPHLEQFCTRSAHKKYRICATRPRLFG